MRIHGSALTSLRAPRGSSSQIKVVATKEIPGVVARRIRILFTKDGAMAQVDGKAFVEQANPVIAKSDDLEAFNVLLGKCDKKLNDHSLVDLLSNALNFRRPRIAKRLFELLTNKSKSFPVSSGLSECLSRAYSANDPKQTNFLRSFIKDLLQGDQEVLVRTLCTNAVFREGNKSGLVDFVVKNDDLGLLKLVLSKRQEFKIQDKYDYANALDASIKAGAENCSKYLIQEVQWNGGIGFAAQRILELNPSFGEALIWVLEIEPKALAQQVSGRTINEVIARGIEGFEADELASRRERENQREIYEASLPDHGSSSVSSNPPMTFEQGLRQEWASSGTSETFEQWDIRRYNEDISR